ncbi:hypothetical protein BDR05DRAFT_953403 [Suillus weaverae]|nr:hypothetical protein BDR05DRAFT_953403 [Suillus weaverae]
MEEVRQVERVMVSRWIVSFAAPPSKFVRGPFKAQRSPMDIPDCEDATSALNSFKVTAIQKCGLIDNQNDGRRKLTEIRLRKHCVDNLNSFHVSNILRSSMKAHLVDNGVSNVLVQALVLQDGKYLRVNMVTCKHRSCLSGPTNPIESKGVILYFSDIFGFTVLGSGVKYCAVDFCFGGPHVFNLAKEGCLIVCDLHFDKSDRLVPMLFSCVETDRAFPKDTRRKVEDRLVEQNKTYHFQIFSGVNHGFAVRCDPNMENKRWAKEECQHRMVAWFKRFTTFIDNPS